MPFCIDRRALLSGALGAAFAAPPAGAEPGPPPAEKMDVARFARDLMGRNYSASGPGAAILVARGGEVLFRGARGEADIERHVAMREATPFRIASVTKQFVAAALLKLVEIGKVGLDDPVARHLPAYPNGGAILVRQLLNHTAGVKDYTAIPGYVDREIGHEATTAQMIAAFADQPADFAPGERWSYSNSGYILIGAIIEAVTALTWHAWLERALFRPLGLRRTGYAGDPRFEAGVATGYSFDDDRVVAPHPISMSQVHAAGALVSNTKDLLRWNEALHGGRVIGPELYRAMTTPTGAAAKNGASYGFGLYVDKVRRATAFRHGGAIFGYAAQLTYLPQAEITVAVLENDDASNTPESGAIVTRRLAAVALGDPYPALKSVPVEAAALLTAEGVYRFPDDTRRALRLLDGRLTAQYGSGPRARLVPIGKDDFLYEDGFNRLILQREGGSIVAVRFFPNGDGEGELGVRTNEPLPEAVTGMRLPRTTLDRLAGDYAGGRLTLRVFVDGEILKAQLGGQDAIELKATSATRFVVGDTGADLEFSANEGPASEAIIRQGGREMLLKRTP
jgi:CubicO group peptidase (beta-lactamase class C family)